MKRYPVDGFSKEQVDACKVLAGSPAASPPDIQLLQIALPVLNEIQFDPVPITMIKLGS